MTQATNRHDAWIARRERIAAAEKEHVAATPERVARFAVVPTNIPGWSLIQWHLEDGRKANTLRSVQVETEIAVLWAAAQDLLDACEETLTYIEHSEGDAPNGWRLITALKSLRAVIKKARG